MPEDVQQHRKWLLSLVDLPYGGHFLDLGCGTGEDLRLLAQNHPEPEVRFAGLDASEEAIAAAALASTRDPRITVQQHEFEEGLPFPDGSFDAVYSHNLLECLNNLDEFVREVARILRPGGLVVMAHWDWDSQAFNASDKALVRRVIHAFADWKQPWMAHADPWMGRRLWGTFAPVGQFAGEVHARVMTNTAYCPPWYGYARAQDFGSLVKRGLLGADDYQRFVEEQVELYRAGRYFYSITGYAYVGRRRPQAIGIARTG